MARERKHPPKKKRRGRFRLFYQLLSLVAVAAAMVTACVVFFRVNKVEVQGNAHYDAQTIIAASGIEMGDNLVTMWEPDINQQICQQLPYVSGGNMVLFSGGSCAAGNGPLAFGTGACCWRWF